MKHIEVSQKIELQKDIGPEEFKKILIRNLERGIELESISDGTEMFKLSGTTGSPASISRNARLDLDVDIDFDSKEKVARVIISGYSRMARSLTILYWLAFFVLLLVGLLPGSIETSAEGSGAMDALVFLIFGIFIIWDINKKLTEPREFLKTALNSVNTSLG